MRRHGSPVEFGRVLLVDWARARRAPGANTPGCEQFADGIQSLYPSLDRRSVMHALVVRASISDPEAARKTLDEQVVPQMSQAPGFVAGYWTWLDDQSNGQSMIVFESADAARAVEERVRGLVPEGVAVDSTEVREVVASA